MWLMWDCLALSESPQAWAWPSVSKQPGGAGASSQHEIRGGCPAGARTVRTVRTEALARLCCFAIGITTSLSPQELLEDPS